MDFSLRENFRLFWKSEKMEDQRILSLRFFRKSVKVFARPSSKGFKLFMLERRYLSRNMVNSDGK